MLCGNFQSVAVTKSAVTEFRPLPLEQRIKLFLITNCLFHKEISRTLVLNSFGPYVKLWSGYFAIWDSQLNEQSERTLCVIE